MLYSSKQIDGCTVHTYNDGDLIACFDGNILDAVIKESTKRQPLRAVFRDSSFAGSPAKINAGEIFKMLAPEYEGKSVVRELLFFEKVYIMKRRQSLSSEAAE